MRGLTQEEMLEILASVNRKRYAIIVDRTIYRVEGHEAVRMAKAGYSDALLRVSEETWETLPGLGEVTKSEEA